MNQLEGDRIRRVYAGYDSDPAFQRRWDPANPGNATNRAALKYALAALLPKLDHQQVLEIGCGTGDVLALLSELGAQGNDLTGVDLRPDALAQARARFPIAHIVDANAEALPFADEAFDIVAMFTVLSSVLAAGSRQAIAREAARVLRSDGVILWYDMRISNPWNRNVRAIERSELRKLFPGFRVKLSSATLVPQIARRLGVLTSVAFPLLHGLPFLRSHWLGMLKKPGVN